MAKTPDETEEAARGSTLRKVSVGVLIGVLGTLVGAPILSMLTAWVSQYVTYLRPTCTEPVGASLIPTSDLVVSGRSQPDEDTGPETYSPERATDGNPGSLWVPPILDVDQRDPDQPVARTLAVFDDDEASRTLTIKFKGDEERLVVAVCVTNGLTSEYERYRNWGRIRTVSTWTDSNPARTTSTLATGTSATFQDAQQVAVPQGWAKEVYVAPVDAYHGQRVYSGDPQFCSATTERTLDGSQCWLDATRTAGISEIYVYEQSSNLPLPVRVLRFGQLNGPVVVALVVVCAAGVIVWWMMSRERRMQ